MAVGRAETVADGIAEGLTRLVVRHAMADTSPDAIAAVLGSDPGWAGGAVVDQPAPSDRRRYVLDLRLRVSDRPARVTFRKAASIDLGTIRPLGDGWEVEIGWRAATLAPLFPVFSGTLVIRRDEMTLSGWYAPPGGGLGRLADRMLLHLAAEGTGRWLLETIEQSAAPTDAGAGDKR